MKGRDVGKQVSVLGMSHLMMTLTPYHSLLQEKQGNLQLLGSIKAHSSLYPGFKVRQNWIIEIHTFALSAFPSLLEVTLSKWKWKK